MIRLRTLLLGALAAFVLPIAALAATVQMNIKDGDGTTRTVNVVTNSDLTGHLAPQHVVCDGTAAAQCAAVKAASTAAAASDPALVVSLSPNSPLVGLKDSGGTDMTDTTNHALKVVGIGVTDNTIYSSQTGSPVQGYAETSPTALTSGHLGFLSLIPGTRAVRHDVTSLGGTAVDTNSGNKSAGTQRGVLATDQLALAAWGHVATGAAAPSGSTYVSALGSGATGGLTAGLKTCDTYNKYDASDNGSKTLITGVASRVIYICGYIMATGGTATTLKLRYGDDADCATNGTDLTPAYQLVANDKVGNKSTFWAGLSAPAGKYVCINASAGNSHQAEIWSTIQ